MRPARLVRLSHSRWFAFRSLPFRFLPSCPIDVGRNRWVLFSDNPRRFVDSISRVPLTNRWRASIPVQCLCGRNGFAAAPSSSGLGHRPFTPATRVRVPLGSFVTRICPAMTRVLITAFGPYGPWTENSSWLALVELTRSLPSLPAITTRLYPVDFAAVSERLRKICQATTTHSTSDRHLVHVHPTGSDRHQRGCGFHPGNRSAKPLVPDGPVAYQSQLPLGSWAELLRQAGIPARVSYHAGTYLVQCDSLLRTALVRNSRLDHEVRLPAFAADDPTVDSWGP